MTGTGDDVRVVPVVTQVCSHILSHVLDCPGYVLAGAIGSENAHSGKPELTPRRQCKRIIMTAASARIAAMKTRQRVNVRFVHSDQGWGSRGVPSREYEIVRIVMAVATIEAIKPRSTDANTA